MNAPDDLVVRLNAAYTDICGRFTDSNDRMPEFAAHVLEHYGIALEFQVQLDEQKRYGYLLKEINIVDEHKYLIFMLKWTQ
jgi:hypothetical protein